MNVSMGDALNLGWKLAAVLEGRSPKSLLNTYSDERQAVAKDLIDFDKEWTQVLSAKADDADPGAEPKFKDYFIRHGRYTAGTAVRYTPSDLTGDAAFQYLAEGYPIGMRFHSAPVIRHADAKPMQLGHVVEADGRWRILAFADRGETRLSSFLEFLQSSPQSPLARHAGDDSDVDSVIDLRAIYQRPHTEFPEDQVHRLLRPCKGRFGLIDYEKVFCAAREDDIFDARGIDRDSGCAVVIRPDQYVADILPLDGFERMSKFFSALLL